MPDGVDPSHQLSILHDHYKETFSYIKLQERQRDRLFLYQIALVALLFLEVWYPENLGSFLSNTEIKGVGLQISAIPIYVAISATWTFLASLTLRYYQLMVNIDRQYEYLHHLEDQISPLFTAGDGRQTYRREGQHYLASRQKFSTWVWLFYTYAFPIIVVAAVSGVVVKEWQIETAPLYHKIFDTVLMVGVWLSVVLYRVSVEIDRRREGSRN